jgi:hypothetical protein
VPRVVPWLPYSFGSRGGTTVLYGGLAPQQGLTISRLGASIAAYPPSGIFSCETGWGFVTGVAPEGTTTLIVSVEGATVERSGAAALFGSAYAHCELYILCEEFVPLLPVDVQFGPGTLGAGGGPGESIASPLNPLAGRAFSRVGVSNPTVIIKQTTPFGFGLQSSGVLDTNATAENTLTLPIAPGNAYRCWVKVWQLVGCNSWLTPAGWAFCNFTFDFGPIYYTFGS